MKVFSRFVLFAATALLTSPLHAQENVRMLPPDGIVVRTSENGVVVSAPGVDVNTTGGTTVKTYAPAPTGQSFTNSSLKNMDFSQRSMAGADFSNASLSNINFEGSDLRNAIFTNVSCDNCNFRGANLTGADFSNTSLDYNDFRGAIVTSANFSNASFTGSKLHGVDFSRSTVSNASFDNADYKSVYTVKTTTVTTQQAIPSISSTTIVQELAKPADPVSQKP